MYSKAKMIEILIDSILAMRKKNQGTHKAREAFGVEQKDPY